MRVLFRLYYRLTSRIPRLLPRTVGELESLKKILIDVFDLPDEPRTWITVAGHINSTPGYRVRRSHQFLVNVARRLAVNEVADTERRNQLALLQTKLQAAIKKYEAENKDEIEKENASAANLVAEGSLPESVSANRPGPERN